MSKCPPLAPRHLICRVDGLESLWYCTRVGVVPSAVPANFWVPSGKNPSSGVGFTYAFEWAFEPSGSCELETLTGDNPYNRVGAQSMGIEPITESSQTGVCVLRLIERNY